VTGVDTTEDRFLDGAITVFQPARGYRAGMDAVLLAASLSGKDGELCGSRMWGGDRASVWGASSGGVCVHRVRAGCGGAGAGGRGIAANGLGGRVSLRPQDVGERPADLENQFDQAFSNPPFFEPGRCGRRSPNDRRPDMAETPLKAWILFLHHVAKPGGRITLIHRTAVLGDLLELLGPRTGEIEVLPVRPAPGEAAGRVLIRGRKGLRRGPVTLYDGLALHDAPGGPASRRAAEALRGGALEWR